MANRPPSFTHLIVYTLRRDNRRAEQTALHPQQSAHDPDPDPFRIQWGESATRRAYFESELDAFKAFDVLCLRPQADFAPYGEPVLFERQQDPRKRSRYDHIPVADYHDHVTPDDPYADPDHGGYHSVRNDAI